MGEETVVEIVFRAGAPQWGTGRRYVTAQVGGGDRMVVGYTVPLGDAVAAHGSGDEWPQLAVCADETRALGAVVWAWGQQVAESEGVHEDEDH